jgi:adenylate cyclase
MIAAPQNINMHSGGHKQMDIQISEIKRLIPIDISAAKDSADALLKSSEIESKDMDKAEVYHIKGIVHFYADECNEALKWYQNELKLRKKLKDIIGASNVYNNIGAIYYHNGQIDKAILYYQKALSHREKIQDRKGVAGCYENIGAALLKSGKGVEALNMHLKALKINQEIGDTDRIGMSLQNIGRSYLSQSDYVSALTYFRESLAIAEKTNDKIRSIQLMINIGSALLMQNNIEEAKKYHERCYEESKAINYHHGLILSLCSLGDIEMKKGNYADCIRHYLDCIEIAKTTGHIAEYICALTSLGRCYCMQADYPLSISYLHQALTMAKKVKFKDSISEIYAQLSEVYEKNKDAKKALKYFKDYIAVRDELVNKETTKTIYEIKTRYELEKKEKEAEINRLKHIELKDAMDALTAAKKQSDELLLNILPDDVAEELKAKGSVTARYYEQAAVIFIDIKDFTRLSEHLAPQELVSIIDVYFSLFDSIIGDYAIEKIKTIGDAYLCVAGLPVPDPESAFTAIRAALRIRDTIATLNRMRLENGLLTFDFRFGLHVGPVIAGVVGRRKFEYDIWGDTVNTAARMEQNSDAGRINISGDTYQAIKGSFECTYRGRLEAKNKGLMDMYFIERELTG